MDVEQKKELQKEGLIALKKQGEPKFTDKWFPYTSGEVGPYYIQSVVVENDGHDYTRAIQAMCELIRGTLNLDDFDAVSGGESKDWDFSNPVAAALGKAHIKLYKDGKALGAKIEGKRIIHIADLNNEGSSMRDLWVPAINKHGGKIIHTFFYVDRKEQGVKVMEELGIKSSAVVPMDEDAWNFLAETGYITLHLHESLHKRMQNRKEWAHNALLTHLDLLKEMLKSEDQKEVVKAEKVLIKGYPEIREKLLKLLEQRGYVHKFSEEYEKMLLNENKNLADHLTEKETQARKKVCLPLDGLNTLEEVKERVEELSLYVGLFKIGKESYTRFGPEVVKLIHRYGANVFLDLKYHDIPDTVKGAAKAAAELGVYMFNVHASGGKEMMKAAVEGAIEGAKLSGVKPKIIGVTVLTSIDQETLNQQLYVPGKVEEQVLRLAQLTLQSGCDGIVCSAADLDAVKDKLPAEFMYITPGIKGPNTPAGADQKRVFTPGNAVLDGSSILVIGRAITDPATAEERKKAAYEVLQDMARWM